MLDYNKINPSKIITLEVADSTFVGSTSSRERLSWKYNISRLYDIPTEASKSSPEALSKQNSNNDQNFFTDSSGTSWKLNDRSNVDVKEGIELFLEGNIPSDILETHNKLQRPLKAAINGLTGGALDTLSGNTKIGSYAQLASLAANAISAGHDESGGAGFIFDPWVLKAPAWDGVSQSEDIKFDYTFNFRLGQYKLWNAKEEVVKPIMNLAVPTYLRKIGTLRTFGPFPTPGALLAGLVTDGIKDGLSKLTEDGFKGILQNMASALETTVTSCYKDYLYKLSIGPLTFDWVTIKDSKVEWSPETDQHGYPIAGSIKLTFNIPYGPSLRYGDGVPRTVSMKFKAGSN